MRLFEQNTNTGFACLLAALLAATLAACSSFNHRAPAPASAGGVAHPARQALQQLKTQYAPDPHLGIFNLALEPRGSLLQLTGEVQFVQARLAALEAVQHTGLRVEDGVRVLPAPELGEQLWGISCLSVASGREQPEHKAEMGTQVLMGHAVRLWKRSTNAWFTWYLAQSADGYLSWLEKGTFVRCTRQEMEAWTNSPLLIVTAFEGSIREQPLAGAQPVSDVVAGNLVRKTGEQGDWYQVELPDRRAGFLPKTAATDYRAWKNSRRPTPENIESTARSLLGRPYLWGANSPKGLDCSGFTKLVFFLNGIDLDRNASHQSRQGVDVPLDPGLTRLHKGDLLFFGRPARRSEPERVTHVGIYLGDKLFIHSSERVRLNSLDPGSPIRDEFRMRTLLKARRVLKGCGPQAGASPLTAAKPQSTGPRSPTPPTGSFTLWQLPNQTHSQIMSYILRTPAGKIIVIDGGTEGDAPYLKGFLAAQTDSVEAWFITHAHDDHFGALSRLLREPNPPRIKTIYGSLPTAAWVKQYGVGAQDTAPYDTFLAALQKASKTVTELQPGSEFHVDTVRFQVLAVHNPEITANAINNSSLVLRASDSQKSVLFLADLGVEGGRKLLNGPLAQQLPSDYVQMAHHGQQGVDENFYRAVQPRFCLWPTPRWLWDNDSGKGKNSGPWKTLEVRAWMEPLHIQRHYLMADGLAVIQ